MSKRTPLRFELGKTVTATTPAKPKTGLQKNPPTPKHANDETNKQARPDRAGRQFIAAHVVHEAAKQFKLLAVQQDRTVQALLIEAINDLFAKNGLSRIADE